MDAVKVHSTLQKAMAYNTVLTPNNNLVAPRVGIIIYIYTASTKDWCRVTMHCGNLIAFIPGDFLQDLAGGVQTVLY